MTTKQLNCPLSVYSDQSLQLGLNEVSFLKWHEKTQSHARDTLPEFIKEWRLQVSESLLTIGWNNNCQSFKNLSQNIELTNQMVKFWDWSLRSVSLTLTLNLSPDSPKCLFLIVCKLSKNASSQQDGPRSLACSGSPFL